MCFVFVFVALLEYAAVNYFFWGARAKKKKKKSRNLAAANANALPGPGSNYQATYSTTNGRAVTSHDDRKVSDILIFESTQSLAWKIFSFCSILLINTTKHNYGMIPCILLNGLLTSLYFFHLKHGI